MDKKATNLDYVRPELDGKPKKVVRLGSTERAFFGVQIIGEGGENNLHSHTHLDGFWFVLRGRARFYTTGDEVIRECGPMEGVLVPRGYPYWFESVGDEELEILQFEASDVEMANPGSDRVDLTPQKEWMAEYRLGQK